MANKRIKDLPAFSGTIPNNAVFALETSQATQKVEFSALKGAVAPVGSKSVTANGTYAASSDNLYGYNQVNVNVPNTFDSGDNGKVVQSGALVAQTSRNVSQNGTYDTTTNNQVVVNVTNVPTLVTKTIAANGTYEPADDDADGYSQVIANVPNTYVSGDEGKVVSSGALVAQTSLSVSQNGTYNTTTNNEVVVNVAGGADPLLYYLLNNEYYCDTANTLLCTLNGREYYKVTADPAYVAYYVNTSDGPYTGPILVSKTADGANFFTDGYIYRPTEVQIANETWYVSTTPYFMQGDQVSSAGMALKLENTYSSPENAAPALLSVAQVNHINSNGTYTVPTGYDGFGKLNVNVNQNVGTLLVTANGTYAASSDNLDGYNTVNVNVSGGGGVTYAFIIATYTSGATCTASNGTITFTAPDTSGTAVFAIPTPASTPETWTVTATSTGNSGSAQVSVSSYGSRYTCNINVIPDAYQAVEYLEVGSTAGPYINPNLAANAYDEFEIVQQYTGTPDSDTYFFGRWEGNRDSMLGYYDGYVLWYIGNSGNRNITFDNAKHTYYANGSAAYVDGAYVFTPNLNDRPNGEAGLFTDITHTSTKYCRIFSCKIWNAGVMLRDFVPCYRKSDNVPGMYDTKNSVFYVNAGSGSFAVGPDA